MRGIYCFKARKMLSWSWFREMSVLYWSENMKILDFFKIVVLRIILCEKSIQRIPKRCGKNIIFQGRWSRMHFDTSGMRWIDFSHKITLRTMILEEKSQIFASIQNTHFPESGSGKHSQASRMRATDSPHKTIFRKMILGQETQNFLFSLQYTHLFPWIRVKEAFSSFGNARNRFPA